MGKQKMQALTPKNRTKTEDSLRGDQQAMIFAMGLGLGLSGLYIGSLPQDLVWGDTPELLASAWVLGIPHPTGYSFYMTVLRVFQWLPLGSIAFRGHLFSTLCTVLTCMILFRFLEKSLHRVYGDRSTHARLPAFCATLAYAVSSVVWSQATAAEVYPLFTLLWVVTLVLLDFFRRQPTAALPPLAFLAGWQIIHHRLSLFILLVGLGFVAFTNITHKQNPGTATPLRRTSILKSGIYLLLPLLYFVYFPLRAAQEPSVNWYDPDTFSRFRQLIGGNLYTDNLQRGLRYVLASGFKETFQRFLLLPLLNYGFLLLPALLGFFVLLWRERWLGISSVFLFIFHQIFFLLYLVGDWEVFLLPALLVLTLPIAFGLAEIFYQANRQNASVPFVKALSVLVCAVSFLPAFMAIEAQNAWMHNPFFPPLFPYSLRQALDRFRNVRDISTYEYARQVFSVVPENAPIITGLIELTADNEYYPLLYQQVVERRRPDAPLFGAGFLYFDWYRDQANRRLPIHLQSRDDQPYLNRQEWLEAIWQTVLQPCLERGPLVTPSYDLPPSLLIPSSWYKRAEFKILREIHIDLSLVPPSYQPYIPARYARIITKRTHENEAGVKP